ncbi:MAG: aldo/keto reductase [Defluviitaleaceae bacterium]|nr:aldo/keto reductase [Defluviitaleaceae bacterium]
MQFRADKSSGNKLSALGFGCMRFPQIGSEAERMVLSAVQGGVNFFDTAYLYPNNEKTLGAILKKLKLREKVYIATKLPISLCKTYEDFDKFLLQQLKRLQTDYIDYYLLHNITVLEQWEDLKELGIEKWFAEKKASGQIRQIGFSYHGSGDVFPKLLDAYSWEFCMIQYNYYDENYQAGKKGLLLAAEKGLSVIVMEPLLGGRLATGLPKKAKELFANANPNKTPAEWALQWLWNHEEVTVVLSGMSNTAQAEANMKAASDFMPLKSEELAVFDNVAEVFRQSFKVKCTGCNYCLPCPKGIDIPARLTAYNASYAQSYFTGLVLYLTGMGAVAKKPISVYDCNNCGKCEKQCPQSIKIREELKKVGKRMESLPFRIFVKLMRLFIR